MSTNYIEEGEVLHHVAAAAISSGDVVALHDCIGIALTDIASGATGAVKITGVFQLPKTTGVTIAQGEKVDFDASAGTAGEVSTGITPASGDVQNFGVAAAAAASGDTTINVKLEPGNGTYTA